MSLARSVLQGRLLKNPEKRFSSNNIAVTTFAINISPSDEEQIVRVVALGKNAELAEQKLSQGTLVIVEGRIQTNTIKTVDGEEKRIIELEAQGIEVVSGISSDTSSSANEELLKLSDEDFSDDLIGEDEIPF